MEGYQNNNSQANKNDEGPGGEGAVGPNNNSSQ